MAELKSGCAAYGGGLRLMALRRELAQEGISEQEKARIEAEIAELEHDLGWD